ncbi:hypothetical protein Fot_35473 [Forsythia ovata]|uniref:Uncharacterized protein n=1 Tax=Forsythia ovata TaxID=205694 RepID=A0ABD1SLM6_9LAMI
MPCSPLASLVSQLFSPVLQPSSHQTHHCSLTGPTIPDSLNPPCGPRQTTTTQLETNDKWMRNDAHTGLGRGGSRRGQCWVRRDDGSKTGDASDVEYTERKVLGHGEGSGGSGD